jgi:hypothetical protein
MKKTIITISVLALTIPMTCLAFCPDPPECNSARPQQAEEQSVTGSASEATDQAAPKGRAREMTITDFVVGERAPEKDSEPDDRTGARRPLKTQPEPRSPEKKSCENSCD